MERVGGGRGGEWGAKHGGQGRDGQLARYTFGRLKRITFDISIGQSGFLLDIRRGIIADSCRKALRAPRDVIKLQRRLAGTL